MSVSVLVVSAFSDVRFKFLLFSSMHLVHTPWSMCVKCSLKCMMHCLVGRKTLLVVSHSESPVDLPCTLKTTKISSCCKPFCKNALFFFICMHSFLSFHFFFSHFIQSTHTCIHIYSPPFAIKHSKRKHVCLSGIC